VPNPLDLFGRVGDYLKGRPYWSRIEPFFTLLSLYATTVVLAYEYVQWRYHIAPALPLYLSSYIFRQITVVFAAIGAAGYLLGRVNRSPEAETLGVRIRRHSRLFLRQAAVITLVAALAAPAIVYLSPARVSRIRIKFLAEPDFNKFALTYLIYELNRMQNNWYFEVDFDTFNDGALTSRERTQCESAADQSMCYALILAGGRPFVGITKEKLGDDYFFKNQGAVSVISTYGWQQYAPPSTYEFLIYSLVVQSILIHLNANGPGLPGAAYRESRVSIGELFQFSPRRQEMKAAILAPHLTPGAEELLLNSFGVEYLSTCRNMLSLDWLHTQRVTQNLEKNFSVKL
jgi:hypothetical protein